MERICKKCGGVVGQEDLYCIHCGMPLEKEKQQEPKEAEPEEKESHLAEPLRVGEYVWIGLLLCIPIVNLIVALYWIFCRECNPNRRNLAKAWLILAAVGTLLAGIVAFGMFRMVLLPPMPYEYHHYEYVVPYEEEWEEVTPEYLPEWMEEI